MPVGDAERGAAFFAQPLMRRGRRMGHEALGVAEIVGDLDHLQRPAEIEGRAFSAPRHRWRSSCRPSPSAVAPAYIADGSGGPDRRPASRPDAPSSAAASFAALDACRSTRISSVSSAFRSTQALNGLSEGPVCLRIGEELFLDPGRVGEDDAAEAAPLPVDVLGRRIDDDVRAELQRLLEERRREDVVDDQPRARPCGRSPRRPRRRSVPASGSTGVSRKNALVCGLHRAAPRVEIGAVDQRRGDAEPRQELARSRSRRSRTERARRRHGRRRRGRRGARRSPPPCRSPMARAASAPSRRHMRSSNMATVGLA